MIIIRCMWANKGARLAALFTAIFFLSLALGNFDWAPLSVLLLIVSPPYAVGATVTSVRSYWKAMRHIRYYGPWYFERISKKHEERYGWWECPIVGIRLALLDYARRIP